MLELSKVDDDQEHGCETSGSIGQVEEQPSLSCLQGADVVRKTQVESKASPGKVYVHHCGWVGKLLTKSSEQFTQTIGRANHM
jgi:hypothetical protein